MKTELNPCPDYGSDPSCSGNPFWCKLCTDDWVDEPTCCNCGAKLQENDDELCYDCEVEWCDNIHKGVQFL